MSKANREISIFNLSFLDVLSNGMGAVILLSFIFAALPKNEPGEPGQFATGTFLVQSLKKQPLRPEIRPVLTIFGPPDATGKQIVGTDVPRYARKEILIYGNADQECACARFFLEDPMPGEWKVEFQVDNINPSEYNDYTIRSCLQSQPWKIKRLKST